MFLNSPQDIQELFSDWLAKTKNNKSLLSPLPSTMAAATKSSARVAKGRSLFTDKVRPCHLNESSFSSLLDSRSPRPRPPYPHQRQQHPPFRFYALAIGLHPTVFYRHAIP